MSWRLEGVWEVHRGGRRCWTPNSVLRSCGKSEKDSFRTLDLVIKWHNNPFPTNFTDSQENICSLPGQILKSMLIWVLRLAAVVSREAIIICIFLSRKIFLLFPVRVNEGNVDHSTFSSPYASLKGKKKQTGFLCSEWLRHMGSTTPSLQLNHTPKRSHILYFLSQFWEQVCLGLANGRGARPGNLTLPLEDT